MTVSPHCKKVLEEFEKNLPEKCFDFKAVRAYTMCKAWKFIEEEKIPFKQAIRKAWKEAKELCSD